MKTTINERRIMSEPYIFKRYPIFKYERNWSNPNPTIKDVDTRHLNELGKKVAENYLKSAKNASVTVAIFDGVEEVIATNEHFGIYTSESNIMPSFLDIEKDPKKASQAISRTLYAESGDDSFMSKILMNIAYSMLETSKYWDDQLMFRFYAINEFISSNKNNKTTFGSYLKRERKALVESFRYGIGTENKHSLKLAYLYGSEGHFLRYNVNEPEKDCIKLIESLTKKELLDIAESNPQYYPPAIGRNYTKTVEKIIQNVKSPKVVITHEDLYDIGRQLFVDSLSKYEISFDDFNSRERYRLMEIMMYNFSQHHLVDNHMREQMLKKLDESSDKLEPYEILAFILVLGKPKFFFNRASVSKAYEVINYGLTEMDIEPELFIRFVIETVMTYNYELPAHSDWALFLKNEGCISDHIPPSLLIPLMLNKERNQKRGITELEKYRNLLYLVKNRCIS